jgi:lipoprotein-releasing system permease protein
LISKKSHNAINIISGISVAGVAVGTMALVIVLSAFNGLTNLVQSLYNSFDPAIEITAKQGKTFDPLSTEFQKLKTVNGVANYTEVLEGNALVKYNDKQCIVTVKGVSEAFEQMSGFDSLIREGNFNIARSNVVVGKGISYVLQTAADDFTNTVSIYAPKRGTINTLNPEDGLNELKSHVAGTFTINDEFDYRYVIMNIEKARTLLDYTQEVSSIELSLNATANIEKVQQEISTLLGNKYEVKNREQQNVILYRTMRSEKLWTFLILLFILIIATFNVIGSLTMLIIEKKKDIVILHNMGADIQLIRKIFLVEGILITMVGAFVGLILGIGLCLLQQQFEFVKFTEGYVVSAYPVKVELLDVSAILGAVILIGFFAAWYPVRIFTKKHLAF